MAIKKNDEFRVTIESVTALGSGVARHEGMVIFVTGGVTGDTLLTHIIKVKKTYCIGIIKEIITPSPHRRESLCPIAESCGGCAYRQVSYAYETEIKQKTVEDAIQRIGKIRQPVEKIIACPQRERYRNKAQYPIRRGENGRITAGFFAQKTHRVIECEDCLLQPEEFSAILKEVRLWAEEYGIEPYDEESGRGILRHLYLRKGEKTGEILVCPVVTTEKVKHTDELIKRLEKTEKGIKSIVLNVNRDKTNVVLGDRNIVLTGEGYITDELCGMKFRLSPFSFYQVNRSQAEVLYAKAYEFAELKESDLLLDLYCGVGTIGLCAAPKVKKVIGAEIVPQAVSDAKTNAKINGIENAEFICADAGEAALKFEREGLKPDVIIVDPPRKGLSPEVIEAIGKMAPERLVYVSCDPATLARDLNLLEEANYRAVRIQPVDMFPGTGHVETVVLMTRK